MNKIISIVFFILLTTLVAGFIGSNKSGANQPLAYNHNKHVEENGMECLDCHQYAEENPRASIPNIEVCVDCHEEAISESEEEKILVNFITENKKIPWRQIYSVPDYAYFSHRRHVKLGELECQVCHGNVGNLTIPITRPFIEMKMNWCMDCHEKRGVSNDCYACHR
ncbi:MAG: cytochrome c3 family protein [bacterium]